MNIRQDNKESPASEAVWLSWVSQSLYSAKPRHRVDILIEITEKNKQKNKQKTEGQLGILKVKQI